MKTIVNALIFAVIGLTMTGCTFSSGPDVSDLPKYEKNGFVTTKWCAERDYFKDCPLETFHCGYEGCWKDQEPAGPSDLDLVLWVDSERTYYNVKIHKPLKIYEIEEIGFGRNDVTLRGYYNEDTDTIIATEFDAPPPPSGEFYKGCL